MNELKTLTSDRDRRNKKNRSPIIPSAGGGGSSLTVFEQGVGITVTNVKSIRVPNGALTDLGDGIVAIATGGGSGGVTDGDYGDITVSGGGAVWTVKNGVVTFAEIGSKPTTLAGYGITDAYPLSGNPSNFLTANQTITLSGNVTGSGTTSIVTTIAAGVVTNAMLAGSIANTKLVNSSVTINSGIALVGGGAVALGAALTLDLDIPELIEETTIASGDFVIIYDVSASAHRKMTRANFVAGLSGGGGIADGDYGDITVSGSGTVWTVDSSAIDFAELANKPTTLAGYGITDAQPLDQDLTDIAALSANGLLRKSGGVWAMDSSNYLTSNQTITLSGDVTGSGTTAISTVIATTIPNNHTFSGIITFSKATVNTPVTLTDAATITTDASLGNRFSVTLGGNRTLGNPTNPTNGQQIVYELIQDGTGSRTLSLDTKFAFGTDITGITLTTTAAKRDFLTAIYNSTADKWYVVAFVKGY